jgi:hypothetical protein
MFGFLTRLNCIWCFSHSYLLIMQSSLFVGLDYSDYFNRKQKFYTMLEICDREI